MQRIQINTGLASCVCFLLLAGQIPAAAFEVVLTVEESAGIPRTAAPVSGGIPLPKGLFRPEQAFALLRKDGTELPCQVLPLVTERDGTLRWILVDFQDDVAAGATQRYVLRAVAPSARRLPRRPRLIVAETDDEVSIDTGRIRIALSRKKPFALFDVASSSGEAIARGETASYVQLQGRSGWNDPAPWRPATLLAGVPDAVTVRYAGPLRVTLEVTGAYVDDPCRARYKAWITAWAGQSRVHVKFKLCNSNPDQYTVIPVQRSTLRLALTEPPGPVRVGADHPITLAGDAWLHQGLLLHAAYQDIPGAAKAGHGDTVVWTASGPAQRPVGWLAAGSPHPVFVCDRLFSSNPARRLAVRGGRLILDGIAERFAGPHDRKSREGRRVGQPWLADGFWLYDCSHHTSEYLFDFAAPKDAAALDALAAASRNRLWLLAPGRYYAACEALGTGHFATQEEELACYDTWGWTYRTPTSPAPAAHAFVAREDNHYESEADSVQGLLLMYLRTGARGWFDQGEAWARYHMDLQTWRTDGWAWKDGGIWFPSGGPQGNRPVRTKWNFAWGANWGDRKDSADCADLWTHARSKSCYCHFYGSGLADYYCLTGDPDALAAALDNVEQKDDEFRHFRKLTPGKSAVASIRGFGRGFEVMMRVLMACPQSAMTRDLCHLCARTLWRSPLFDERGFHASKIGGGWGGMPAKHLTPAVRRWMDAQGIRFTTEGDTVATLSKGGRTWPVRCMGGTWQHIYVQNGADLYARVFDDDDMRDFTIAFARMSARFMLSPKCHQTWYYTYFDVPDLGRVFDPWRFEHTGTQDGEGCVHSGWYTRFYPDAVARGYSWTGERDLLERAREFWYYGSKRKYRSKHLSGGPKEVVRFADHIPPKDDTVLSVSRLHYEVTHPRGDAEPPAPVTDLRARRLGDGRLEVRFTAPADRGGGRVLRYQVKADALPIVPYAQWEFARDAGVKRNWWRAVNCRGEPSPKAAGAGERFVVTGAPAAATLYVAVRSFDDHWNRSAISNVVTAEP